MADVNKEQLFEQIREVIVEQLGVEPEKVTLEARFREDLEADSLDQVELIMEFEDEFDMSIPDEEAEKIQTVGAAIDYIVNVARSRDQQ